MTAAQPLFCRSVRPLAGDDDGLVLLEVEAGGRADVTDLARVHRSEGPGEATAAWGALPDPLRPDAALLLLDVHVLRPVHCELRVALRVDRASWPQLRPVLAVADRLALRFDDAPLGDALVLTAPRGFLDASERVEQRVSPAA